MEYLLPYLCIVTAPHIMVGLERMLDYRGVGLARFHCTTVCSFSSGWCVFRYVKYMHMHPKYSVRIDVIFIM